jgi:hypothetical protein
MYNAEGTMDEETIVGRTILVLSAKMVEVSPLLTIGIPILERISLSSMYNAMLVVVGFMVVESAILVVSEAMVVAAMRVYVRV